MSRNQGCPRIYAGEDVTPDAAERLCRELLLDLARLDSKARAKAAESVALLIEERLDDIASAPPYSDHTRFLCEDLIAGDTDHIFLSVGEWPGFIVDEERPISGFVFDSEKLLQEGGILRRHDLLDFYHATLSDFLYSPGGAKTVSALKRAYEAGRKEVDLKGSAALRALKNEGSFGFEELLFPGRLPLDWAVEIWENGEKIWQAYKR